MKLLDVVVLTREKPELNLQKGQVGTVVEVYDADDFEVEFVDLQGKTYALETLNSSDLMQIHYKPVMQTAQKTG